MKNIRCLMFDMGGVLTQDQREDKVTEMMGILGSGFSREAFFDAYFAERTEYDRGKIMGSEYWQRVARPLGAVVREPDFERLVHTDLESWFNMRGPMLEFLGGVRTRVGRLVLLSNIHVDGARYLRQSEGRAWTSHFDFLILSCEHGLLKPEIEIYELALDAAEALPNETLFIDDNADNVEGALRAGMSSFRFAGEEAFAATLASDYELTCRA
ncbi:MAG: HAD family phosphatase [Rectinemataceae bacterium]|jgi:putative hydrolase of the HAD superfamily